KMLGDKIEWPWGKAVCQSKLELPRAPLAKAMSEPEYEIVMPQQKVRCTLAQEGERRALRGRGHHVAQGEVQGQQGDRGHGQLGTGICAASHLSADLCRHGAGQLDHVLGPEVVRLVNGFITKKCAELKAELSTGKAN